MLPSPKIMACVVFVRVEFGDADADADADGWGVGQLLLSFVRYCIMEFEGDGGGKGVI